MVLFLELALHVVVRVDDFLFRDVLCARLEFPVREVYDGFGVDVDFAVPDFEVQVRTGRFSRVARQSDDIAWVYLVSDLHEPLRKVPV